MVSIPLAPTCRSVYPDCPSSAVVAAFLEHVRLTGEPETFPTISTTRPPDKLRVLHTPVHMPDKRRADGGRAPCPLCSPTSSKWLSRGALIWCADTAAIYAIGPRCSTGPWRQKIEIAINAFNEADQAKRDAQRLVAHLEALETKLDWIGRVHSAVAQIDALQASFDRTTA